MLERAARDGTRLLFPAETQSFAGLARTRPACSPRPRRRCWPSHRDAERAAGLGDSLRTQPACSARTRRRCRAAKTSRFRPSSAAMPSAPQHDRLRARPARVQRATEDLMRATRTLRIPERSPAITLLRSPSTKDVRNSACTALTRSPRSRATAHRPPHLRAAGRGDPMPGRPLRDARPPPACRRPRRPDAERATARRRSRTCERPAAEETRCRAARDAERAQRTVEEPRRRARERSRPARCGTLSPRPRPRSSPRPGYGRLT
jgi:hypothetical protein